MPSHHTVGQVYNPSKFQGHLPREYPEPDSSHNPVSFLKGLELLDSKSSHRERCCGTFALFPIFQKTIPAAFKVREESLMSLGPGLLDPANQLIAYSGPTSCPIKTLSLCPQLSQGVASSCLRFPSTQTAHNARGHTGPPSPCPETLPLEAAVWSVLSWMCLPAGPSLDTSLLPAVLLQIVPSRIRAPVVL